MVKKAILPWKAGRNRLEQTSEAGYLALLFQAGPDHRISDLRAHAADPDSAVCQLVQHPPSAERPVLLSEDPEPFFPVFLPDGRVPENRAENQQRFLYQQPEKVQERPQPLPDAQNFRGAEGHCRHQLSGRRRGDLLSPAGRGLKQQRLLHPGHSLRQAGGKRSQRPAEGGGGPFRALCRRDLFGVFSVQQRPDGGGC